MADSMANNSYAVNGNPDVASMFTSMAGKADLPRFAAPGNPNVGSMFTQATIADMPKFSSPGNPKGVNG